MSGISAQYADGLEFRIKDLREQVEKLAKERDEWKDDAINGGNAGYLREQLAALAEQVEELTKAYDQCGRTVQDYGRTIDQTESRLREVATHCANVEQQLLTLAEQNVKLRAALDIAHAHADSLADSPEEMRFVNGVRLLPDLASPILNRIRAEGMEMAADICSEKHSLSVAEEAIRAQADQLTKGDPSHD